jgi:quercetin dioxygenase-like cupin family protein
MRRRALVVVALLASVSLACGTDGDTSSIGGPSAATSPSATNAPSGVVREILAEDTDPPGAPGRTLSLVRYTIPAGAKLSPHIHPGVQMASIESGTLTYHVISGSATVQRAPSVDGEPVSFETFTGPTMTTLGAGDAVIETGDMVHYGANDTDQPIVILATLLTETGQDLAATVTTLAGQ